MCLIQPALRGLDRVNWDGDRIVFESIVPSSRLPIGRVSGRAYDIDVREFLVSENNAVTKRVLRTTLPEHFRALCQADGRGCIDLESLTRRGPGDFDARAHLIGSFVSATIRYRPSEARRGPREPRDAWQFPDETLSLKTGDCEDIAFLLASLLLASGISGYNVRVALGKVIQREGEAQVQICDHMWVMYKSEAGRWLVLEPLRLDRPRPGAQARRSRPAQRPGGAPSLEYRPFFLFNDDHLWRVEQPGEAAPANFQSFIRRAWTRLDPGFVGEVHQSLLHDALHDVAPAFVRDALDRHFSRIFGKVVEDVDLMTQRYDCRDHFDNGFIAESWQRVNQRLDAFAENNRDLDAFALAAHGIADFYAHSAYLHFARVDQGAAQPYDPAQPAAGLARTPDYGPGSDFDIASGEVFSRNAEVFSGTPAQAAAAWQGELVSGRYAQPGDSHDVFEALTFIPRVLLKSPGFARRGALPHHEEIAVDEENPKHRHAIYHADPDAAPDDRLAYRNQFAWRRETAMRHIRQAFTERWRGGA